MFLRTLTSFLTHPFPAFQQLEIWAFFSEPVLTIHQSTFKNTVAFILPQFAISYWFLSHIWSTLLLLVVLFFLFYCICYFRVLAVLFLLFWCELKWPSKTLDPDSQVYTLLGWTLIQIQITWTALSLIQAGFSQLSKKFACQIWTPVNFFQSQV